MFKSLPFSALDNGAINISRNIMQQSSNLDSVINVMILSVVDCSKVLQRVGYVRAAGNKWIHFV